MTAVALFLSNKTLMDFNKLKIVNYDVYHTTEVNLRDTMATY